MENDALLVNLSFRILKYLPLGPDGIVVSWRLCPCKEFMCIGC